MDKEWLERRLYKRVGTIYGVQEKTEDVDAIAAQHKQELARARSEKTELLPCGHPASVVEDDGCAMCNLEAQVAVMGTGLRAIRDEVEPSIHLSSMDLRVWNMAVDTLSLSAAPKVVARLEGKALKRMDGSLLVMARHDDAIQIYHASDDGHYERGYSTLGEPIEQAMVLVVECLPPGEQLEESEQGYKAACGVLPWDESDERPEDVIARLRGRPTESEQEATDG